MPLEKKVETITKRRYRAILDSEYQKFKEIFRDHERRLVKAELREKQLIILLKSLLDKVHLRREQITIREIVRYMNNLIKEHDEEPDYAIRLFDNIEEDKDEGKDDNFEMIGISNDLDLKEVDINEKED